MKHRFPVGSIRDPRGGRILWTCAAWIGLVWVATPSYAQTPPAAEAAPAAAEATPPAVTAEPLGAAPTNSEMLLELRALRKEVNDAKALKDQVIQLQNELANMKGPSTVGGAAATGAGVVGADGSGTNVATSPGEEMSLSGEPVIPQAGKVPEDDFRLRASYRYNGSGTGALGGGGYVHFGDDNDEFGINLTNQITIDSTNFDRQNMPTIEQGFNIPFARTFLYGNITKDWKFQIGTQGFLGQFNLLDMWMAYTAADWLTIRAGKGLTPPLYEYYAFSPALEPVITNSPLFQFAAARPVGVMATGNLLGGKAQYWSGMGNGAKSTFYALDRNVTYYGAFELTPFKGTGSFFENLGGGFGYSAGWQNYALQQNGISFANSAGESSTNSSYITSSGVPFFEYNNNVRAKGEQIRVSPHIYYYGRFSVLAEYMLFSRELTDGTTTGRSTQRAYYVNLSYYLTGERDFGGNGFQGYGTTQPLRPFAPSKGEWGPGAWQIAAQFSEVNAGTGDFARGFADGTRWTNRLDQLMVGVNWWPNKYTRLSCDYVWTYFNRPIAVNSPLPIQTFNTIWLRAAMFF